MSFLQSIEAHLLVVFDNLSADVDSGVVSRDLLNLTIELIEAWHGGYVYTELELASAFPGLRSLLHTLQNKYALPVAESRHGYWIVRTPEDVNAFETRFKHKLVGPVITDVLVEASPSDDDFLKAVAADVAAAEKRLAEGDGEGREEMRKIVAHFKAQWPNGSPWTETQLTGLFVGNNYTKEEFDKVRRRVREHIRVLRTEIDMPIIASIHGYWLARDLHEATVYTRRFIKTGWSSIVARMETCDAFRKKYHVTEDALGPLRAGLQEIAAKQKWSRRK